MGIQLAFHQRDPQRRMGGYNRIVVPKLAGSDMILNYEDSLLPILFS